MGSGVFWAIVGGFLCGVFVRSYVPLGYTYALLLALVAVAIFLVSVGNKEKINAAILIAAFCVSCGAGIARMGAATISGDPILTAHLNQKIMFEGTITAEPDVRDSDVLLTIDARDIVAPTTTPVHARVLAITPAHTSVAYGDVVRASGKLSLPAAFNTGEGRSFDYPDYLGKSGIAYELSPATVERTGESEGNPIQAFAIAVKERYVAGIDSVLPEPEAGLAAGITAGDKRSIGAKLTEEFQKTSLVQIIVLSGYNITVVLDAVAKILLWSPRFVQFGASGAVVLFFILMSGGAASASRAGLMALLAVAARTSGRVFLASRALGFAAFVLVAWNPFTLAFDPGFQLSAAATVGLIALTPLFDARLQWIPARFGLREIVASSAGAQIAVLPLILYQSGTLSIVALPANILAMAPMPLAMLFSFIAAVGGMLLGSFATVVALPAYVLLDYIINVAEFLSSIPFASVQIGAFSPVFVFASYALMILATWHLYKKKERPVHQ